CPLITSAPVIPGRSMAEKHSFSDPVDCTELPRAVAAASAKARLSAMTVAASAQPKDMDGPTVAELVQMPKGLLRAGIWKARSRIEELPAYIPTSMGLSFRMQTSPPLSTMA